jgi:hypothetical protein
MSEVVCPTNIKAERCATGQIESPVATLGYRLVQRKARGKNKERGESLRRRATSTQEYSRVSSSLRSISIAIVFCAGLKDRGHQLEMNLDPAADDEDPGASFGSYNHMSCPFRIINKDEIPISKTCRNNKSELRHMKFVFSSTLFHTYQVF